MIPFLKFEAISLTQFKHFYMFHDSISKIS